MSSEPYVLTDDLHVVFSSLNPRCNPEALDASLKQASDRIVTALKEIYPHVDRIQVKDTADFLEKSIVTVDGPVISLIPLTQSGILEGKQIEKISSSRTVRPEIAADNTITFHSIGSMPRNANAPSLEKQFSNAVRNIKKSGRTQVHLIDDVVFTGGTIVTLTNQLKEHGIHVQSVIADVAVQEGIGKLTGMGIEVTAEHVYANVVDEVCMRDFVVGAPAGGRNLQQDDGSYASVPYLSPFGIAESWASIAPENVSDFSRTCLEASLQIWTTIGDNTKFKDLPRPIFGCDPDAVITDTIEALLRQREYEKPSHIAKIQTVPLNPLTSRAYA